MQLTYYLILIASILSLGWIFSLGAYALFSKLAMLDAPDERSNHTQPVPTGVGVGFVTIILGFLMVVNAPGPIILGGIMLLVVSLIDDRTQLPALKRFGFHVIAVIFALHIFEGQVFQGLLPVWLDMMLTAFIWLWAINLTNFMDGIDEMSITQGASMCGGIVVLTLLFADVMPQPVEVDALVILLGLLSFYPFNRHPARCFMGDSGSVPLGFLFGYLMLALSAAGQWHVALILPAYYVVDATLTLLLRVLRGAKPWQAHSQHFYQQAVRAGRSHRWAVRHVLVLNLILIMLAFVALYLPHYGLVAVAGAYVSALLLCTYFASQKRQPVSAESPPHEARA